jgi:hypothetical protein
MDVRVNVQTRSTTVLLVGIKVIVNVYEAREGWIIRSGACMCKCATG